MMLINFLECVTVFSGSIFLNITCAVIAKSDFFKAKALKSFFLRYPRLLFTIGVK